MRAIVCALALALGACRSAAPAKIEKAEPIARPVPVELSWPDAGVP